ncbi:aldo/keto reductase [Actinomyces provencensis]|uniref:aldo/keto reductase n=2 Tax=Actinomyces TaxID=1654 RepID=UPI00096A6485|nr:aldo/keto reductase [Actinomyces provencensis]
MTTVRTLTMNDGHTIPQIGFGVFLVPDTETKEAVGEALEAGYRHIDTATIYGNEEAVGQALADSGLPRDEVFVTTKLWNADQGRDSARPALEASLERLGLDHVDLYLIHWPTPARDLYLPTWEAFEELRSEGLTRSIGVSNFLPEHLRRIADLGGTVPAVNQIELHPTLQQVDIQEADASLGILTEAWSPLGRGADLEIPAIDLIATRLGVTPAQVVLAWHLARGRVVIPKSVTPSRIVENLAAADVVLDDADLEALDALEAGIRIGSDPATFNE